MFLNFNIHLEPCKIYQKMVLYVQFLMFIVMLSPFPGIFYSRHFNLVACSLWISHHAEVCKQPIIVMQSGTRLAVSGCLGRFSNQYLGISI